MVNLEMLHSRDFSCSRGFHHIFYMSIHKNISHFWLIQKDKPIYYIIVQEGKGLTRIVNIP